MVFHYILLVFFWSAMIAITANVCLSKPTKNKDCLCLCLCDMLICDTIN